MRTWFWPIVYLALALVAGCAPEPTVNVKNNANVSVLVSVRDTYTSSYSIIPGGETKSFVGDADAFRITIMPSAEYVAELSSAREDLQTVLAEGRFSAEQMGGMLNRIKGVDEKLASLSAAQSGPDKDCTVNLTRTDDPNHAGCAETTGEGTAIIDQNPEGALTIKCYSPLVSKPQGATK